MSNDITKTGPQSWLELQHENAIKQGVKDKKVKKQDKKFPEENRLNALASTLYNTFEGVRPQVDYVSPQAVIERPAPELNDYGESMWDQPGITGYGLTQTDNIRALNQPLYSKALSGVSKAGVLTGSTFVNGTVGLLVGAVEGIAQKDATRVFDNEVTNAMQQVNEWSEKVLPNYYSYKEQYSPWTSNIFTANMLFDKIVKNAGFTIGAAYTGGVYTKVIDKLFKGVNRVFQLSRGAVKGLNVTEEALQQGEKALKAAAGTRATKAAVGSFFNASAEGTVEANDKANVFEKEQKQIINARKQEEINAAQEEYLATKGTLTPIQGPDGVQMVDLAAEKYNKRLQEIEKTYQDSLKVIEERRKSVATTTWALNLPILFLDDLFLLGKFYAGGWKAARNINKVQVKATKEAVKAAKQAAKEGDFTKINKLNELVQKAEATGFQGLSEEQKALIELTKEHLLGTNTRAVVKAAMNPLREGNEEMAQEFAGQFATIYNASQVDDYFTSSLHPDSQKKALDVFQAIGQAWDKSYGDSEQWEQFFVGAITGLLGSPTFGRQQNNTDQTWLGKGKLIGMSGGAVTAFRDSKNNTKKEQDLLEHANQAIKSNQLAEHLRHFIQQTTFEDNKKRAVLHDDKFEYENAETKAGLSDIMWLAKTGRTDLLDNAVANMETWSDEDIAALHEYTKTWLSGVNLFASDAKAAKDNAEQKIQSAESSLESVNKQLEETPKESKTLENEDFIKLIQRKRELEAELEALQDVISTSDDEIRNKNIYEISPFVKPNGEVMSVEEIKADLEKRIKRFADIRKTVQDIQAEIDLATHESFTDEQIDTLTWYSAMMDDWRKRANLITKDIFNVILGIDEQQLEASIAMLEDTLQQIDDLEESAAKKGYVLNASPILGGKKLQFKNLKDGLNTIRGLLYSARNNGKSLDAFGIVLAGILNNSSKVNRQDQKKDNKDEVLKNAEDIDLGIGSQNEDNKADKDKKQTSEQTGTYGNAVFSAIQALLEEAGTGPQDAKTITALKGLEDLKKIGKAYAEYNKKLQEYWKTPGKVEEDHASFVQKTRQAIQDTKAKYDNKDFDATRPTGKIAAELWNQREQISADVDKFLNKYPKKAREAVKKACDLVTQALAIQEEVLKVKGLESSTAQDIINDKIKNLLSITPNDTSFYNTLKSNGLILEESEYKRIQNITGDLTAEQKEQYNKLNDVIKEAWEKAVTILNSGLDDVEFKENKAQYNVTTLSWPNVDITALKPGDTIEGDWVEKGPSDINKSFGLGSRTRGRVVVKKDTSGNIHYLVESQIYENDKWENYTFGAGRMVASAFILPADVTLFNLQPIGKNSDPSNFNAYPTVLGLTNFSITSQGKFIGRVIKSKKTDSGESMSLFDVSLTLESVITGTKIADTSESDAKGAVFDQIFTQSKENKASGGTHLERREISELWVNHKGRVDGTKYSDALKSGQQEYPPKIKGDKEREQKFLKFVEATEKHLEKTGAFEFIKNKGAQNIKAGQEVFIYTSSKLNEEAGCTVLLLGVRQDDGNIQCIGNYASHFNFLSNEDQKAIQSDTVSSDLEFEAKRYAIQKQVEEKAVDNPLPFTKIKRLMGGSIHSSASAHKVSEIVGAETPMLGVVRKTLAGEPYLDVPALGGASSVAENVKMPDELKPGQIYVLMPQNNGKYIACLCSTTGIRKISRDDPYMNNILEAFWQLAENVNSGFAVLKGYKERLAQFLGINPDFLFVTSATTKEGKRGIKISVRIPKDSSAKAKDDEDGMYLFHSFIQTDGVNEESFKDTVYKRYFSPDSLTYFGQNLYTNVNPQMLGHRDNATLQLTEESKHYAQLVASHLNVYVNTDTGWHSVNDWYELDPTEKAELDVPTPIMTNPAENPDDSSEVILPNPKQEKEKETKTPDSSNDSVPDGGGYIGEKGGPEISDLDDIFLQTTRVNKREKTSNLSTRQRSLHKLRRVLPQIGQRGIVMLDNLIETMDNYKNPALAYGMFRRGIIYLCSTSPVATEWHEAFHFVSHMLLTKQERQSMLDAAKERYGLLSDVELEERAAEAFRQYMKAQLDYSPIGKARRFFFFLKKAIKYLFSTRDALDVLFMDISNGKYADRKFDKPDYAQEIEQFRKEQKQAQKKRYDYNNLDESTKKYLKKQGVSKEIYQQLTPDSQRALLKCM